MDYKRVTSFEAGKWYWFRHFLKDVWRICYISTDSDEAELYVNVPGSEYQQIVSLMDLSHFEIYEVPYPISN